MNSPRPEKFRIIFISEGKKATADVEYYKIEDGVLWLTSPRGDRAKRVGIPMEKVIKIIEY